MSIRRALVPLVLVVAAALGGCGGDGDDGDGAATDPPGSSADAVDGADDTPRACDLLSAADVGEVVGAPVEAGTPTSGPAATGGRFSTCVWQPEDPARAVDMATLTVYPNAAAADSARGSDDMDVEGIGDRAFSGSFASIWVYVDDLSLFAQWYTLSGSDEEHLPRSEALARAAVDAL